MTKYRENLLILIIPLLLLSGKGFAGSTVVTVVKGVAIVAQDRAKPWQKFDEVCVRREGNEIGCGIITKLTGERAVLKLFHPVTKEPRVGDQVGPKEDEREIAASPPPPVAAASPSEQAKPTETPKEAPKEVTKEAPKAEKEVKKFLPFR